MTRPPPPSPASDRVPIQPCDDELVRAAGKGDMNALGALYVRHHQKVFELCCRMVGDADIAEDLTHECFLRVKRYGASFDGQSKATSWLYRLVRNRCLDWFEARDRARRGTSALTAHMAIELEGGAVDEGKLELVREALERLPPEMKEVLVLSRFGDLRYREIADVCGLSVSNVKVRAHRAMTELRRIFLQLEASHELR